MPKYEFTERQPARYEEVELSPYAAWKLLQDGGVKTGYQDFIQKAANQIALGPCMHIRINTVFESPAHGAGLTHFTITIKSSDILEESLKHSHQS